MSWLCLVFYGVIIIRVSSKKNKLEYPYGTNISSHSGVYGIAGPSYEDGEGALVKFDITSGTALTVRVPNTRRPPYTGLNVGCLDSAHRIYFLLYEYWSVHGYRTALYPYDLLNATEYDPIILPIASNPMMAADQCAYDRNKGDIFVFGHDAKNELYQLLLRVRFNTINKNATVDLIGNYSLIDDIPFASDDFTIYDSSRDMLWLAGEYGNNESTLTFDYFWIDAKTGEINKKVVEEAVEIQNAAYYPKLDQIVGVTPLGYNEKGWLQFQMLYADPQTLQTVQRFPPFTGTDWYLFEGVFTLDIDDGILYHIIFSNITNGTLLGHLVGVDVNDGTKVTEAQICKNDAIAGGSTNSCPWSIQYWNTNS
eukprot:384845_1